MARNIAIGIQDFGDLIRNQYFYVDKTSLIREWWESGDLVTLITRPRRFGKTLNMSMLEYFFSNRHKQDSHLFENLEIWNEKKYRELQGGFPVLSLSFANIKENCYGNARKKICQMLTDLYTDYSFLKETDVLEKGDLAFFDRVSVDMDDADATMALHYLAKFLYRYYGKKVIVLLDEYDTPIQEAYVDGYWKELTSFMRGLLNASFKTNPWMERGILTGITRVSKESVFSDLNNLEVVTTTSEKYCTAFGFTEQEVFASLEECGLAKEKHQVKRWYDGFVFGNQKDIYNPWSILNFLDKGKYTTYWANTSSNSLIEKLLREGNRKMKEKFEQLLQGESVWSAIEEQIVYDQLNGNEKAVWSLLLASGYLKVVSYETYDSVPEGRQPQYQLALTNFEVKLMFQEMVRGWFAGAEENYNDFIQAFLQNDIDAMNEYMNRITRTVFRYFDAAGDTSGEEPERFYHGFVLGLLVELQNQYFLHSNRESGFGRYDVMLEPKNRNDSAYILEFKVRNRRKETTLEETLASAKQQIQEKQYATELIARGIEENRIHMYGFVFEGKQVLIG
ncbi:AAA family ATPase [Fusicatenibacter sp.]